MKRVWITRTEPGASELAEAVVMAGWTPLKEPLLTIEPTGAPRPSGQFSMCVFLSPHAVRHAENDLGNGHFIAVGPATQVALNRWGVLAQVPDRHDSEGVVSLLQATLAQSLRDAVLVVQGKNGRMLVQEWCRSQRVPCTTWSVYRRVPRRVNVACSDVDALVCDSVESLQLAHAQLRDGKSSLPLVVPSKRIANGARMLEFANVWISDGPSPGAVVSTLKRSSSDD